MARVISDTVGEFYHHYPRVAAIITAQAKGRDSGIAVAWHIPLDAWDY